MSGTSSLGDRISSWNENGQLYFYGGIFSAVASWFLLALFGLVAVFCGYRLREYDRSLAGGVIGVVGGAGVLLWALALTLA